MSDLESKVAGLSVRELKATIKAAGLKTADCIEIDDLRRRARTSLVTLESRKSILIDDSDDDDEDDGSARRDSGFELELGEIAPARL